MFDDMSTASTDPGAFYAERFDGSLRGPGVVALALVAVGLVDVALVLGKQFLALSGVGLVVVVVGSIFAVLGALVGPLVTWFLYAVAFHLLTLPFDGEGEFRETFVATGWGLVPRVLAALVGVALTAAVVALVPGPQASDARAIAEFSNRLATHPLGLLDAAVGLAALLWSGYVWVYALEHVRGVDRTGATVAVVLPVLIEAALVLAGAASALLF